LAESEAQIHTDTNNNNISKKIKEIKKPHKENPPPPIIKQHDIFYNNEIINTCKSYTQSISTEKKKSADLQICGKIKKETVRKLR